ncbi:hypothetical protein [Streptomyces canus]|uniref:hypothetical protein n=1 Tax=Streptomyces canus TaxID=58343 RepID=UPI00225B272B|nr:hypothetical protein [Streptomyces canus]MCX4854928.1 hypothetical protein [Streptomyces canus]
MSVGFLKALAGVFALVGPVVLVGALLELARGESANDPLPRLSVPLGAVVIVVGAIAVWPAWRPSGLFRRAWAGGTVLRRAALAAVSVALVGVPVLFALGSRAR